MGQRTAQQGLARLVQRDPQDLGLQTGADLDVAIHLLRIKALRPEFQRDAFGLRGRWRAID